MNPTEPDPEPVNEWNTDSSWQEWPHGGFWKNSFDGQQVPPVSDPTAVSSGMTANGPDSSPIEDHGAPVGFRSTPSLFDVGRSLSESDPE
jgi:hypothetical protein